MIGFIQRFLKSMTGKKGLLKKMVDAIHKESLDEACQHMFDALDANAKKAEMALELLYTTEPSKLKAPQYIQDGLDWLKSTLISRSSFIKTSLASAEAINE